MLLRVKQMKIILTANKDGLLWTELISVLCQTAKKHKIAKDGIVSFPFVFEAVCRKFSIDKKRCWNCLFFLAEFGVIQVVPYHGIKLNFEVLQDA